MLYYYRARYYDPEIGRFISEDPLGFEAGINFYTYVNNNPVNLNDPMGKLGGPFGAFNMRGVSERDAIAISSFSNTVGLTGTAVAAAPFVAADTVGLSSITVPSEATAGAFARSALTSGAIGGTTAGLGTLATGGDGRDVLINTGVGFGVGAFSPIFQPVGFLANTGKGALLGAGGSTASQLIDIGTDPAKNLQQDFNVGAVLGSALGGATASGLTAPFGNSLGERISAGIFSFGPETAFSAIGERLGAPSASGGFVLYPSKPNTNQLRAVYQK